MSYYKESKRSRYILFIFALKLSELTNYGSITKIDRYNGNTEGKLKE